MLFTATVSLGISGVEKTEFRIVDCESEDDARRVLNVEYETQQDEYRSGNFEWNRYGRGEFKYYNFEIEGVWPLIKS